MNRDLPAEDNSNAYINMIKRKIARHLRLEEGDLQNFFCLFQKILKCCGKIVEIVVFETEKTLYNKRQGAYISDVGANPTAEGCLRQIAEAGK